MSNTNYEDDPDPITNPFYYAQNMDAFYESEMQKIQQEMKKDVINNQIKELPEKGVKKSKLSLKKTICKPTASTSACTSYVIRKETGKAHHVIKICIENFSDVISFDSNLNKTDISVQYLVKEHYDEIKNDTERLINKIVNKLSSVD